LQLQLLVNPVAYTGKLLYPVLGIPLASIGKLTFIGKLPIEAEAIPGIGYKIYQ
jgi:hypothetical protein